MVEPIKVTWNKRALTDLERIHTFYAEKSEEAANKITQQITDAIEGIVFTEQYQVDEILGYPYRRLIVKHWKVVHRSKIVKWIKQENLRKAQYFAGHRYISSTENYLQNEVEGLKEEINRFHPLKET